MPEEFDAIKGGETMTVIARGRRDISPPESYNPSPPESQNPSHPPESHGSHSPYNPPDGSQFPSPPSQVSHGNSPPSPLESQVSHGDSPPSPLESQGSHGHSPPSPPEDQNYGSPRPPKIPSLGPSEMPVFGLPPGPTTTDLFTPELIFTSSSRSAINPTPEADFTSSETTVVKSTQRTLTTELNGTPSQTGTSEVSSPGSTVSRMVPIVGGVTGAAVTIILGLIIFCILRSKRRHRALRSTSDVDVSTPPDIRGQHMSQSAQPSTTPRPFLDFPFSQNCSFSKGIITDSASNSSEQDNQGNTEPVADPFNDVILIERNLSNNDDEVERARNALDNLQVLTSQFEGEFQQLCILAQSGQLTAEDRLKLEEIKRTTGLTIPSNLRHNQRSISRSTSFESSSSLAPPSYHTCST
ncbi:hypothetical protein Agabi119p4_1128 [Agaricus bisporus var. burnettii]|uniref:Uncharacterized protein n=1 Tax=Agaricus bisporus var. burnettii TaxID=192524 RepID=A0A8H7FBT3_AGABI|nr:hypothetical protein Agabi119p4_1128 [Agaricus bisporus var. burnettii]